VLEGWMMDITGAKGFSKTANQPKEMVLTIILYSDFSLLFSGDKRLETGKFTKW